MFCLSPAITGEKGFEKWNFYSNPMDLRGFHSSSEANNTGNSSSQYQAGPSSPHLPVDGDSKVGNFYFNGSTLDKWCKNLDAQADF